MDQLNRSAAAPVKTASDRSFGLVFTAFFGLVAFWPVLHGQLPRVWPLIPAALFALAATLRPGWLAPLNRQWTRLGLVLHKIVNPVVLALIYILTIIPIGLLFKMMGKDPLRLRRERGLASYWIERRPPGPAAESLPRQF
jgi:predicted membrane metal-binding protein